MKKIIAFILCLCIAFLTGCNSNNYTYSNKYSSNHYSRSEHYSDNSLTNENNFIDGNCFNITYSEFCRAIKSTVSSNNLALKSNS